MYALLFAQADEGILPFYARARYSAGSGSEAEFPRFYMGHLLPRNLKEAAGRFVSRIVRFHSRDSRGFGIDSKARRMHQRFSGTPAFRDRFDRSEARTFAIIVSAGYHPESRVRVFSTTVRIHDCRNYLRRDHDEYDE